ncbi:MAG TPA: amidohydrolase family protein [Blastocatellia bacterium]|nr:amidohydrolase family protein [Blastocatellia bacterium]
MFDLIVRNGLLFDGLASPPVRCDIGIQGGRVAAISPHISGQARETVDASGLWVAPGFIDIHTHYDIELEIAPGLAESVRHGVTTIVMGNCSLSLAVATPAVLADIFQRVETLSPILIQKWLRQSVSWRTPREYLDHLRQLPKGPNVAALLGHSALRAHVMGLERSLQERATDEELAEMRRIASEALDAGFIGISVDMVPWHMMTGEFRGRTIPSQHADFREYAMLAGVCRERDAVFQVTPNPQNLLSLLYILRMSLGLARRPLRITVLSALDSVCDRRLWRMFGPLLFVFNKLLGCNIRFQTLTEPFTVYSDGPITPLFEEFPAGVRLNDCDSRAERQALWRTPEFRADFRRQWLNGWRKTFHRDLTVMEIVRCPDPELESKTFAQVARERGRNPVDVFMDLLADYDTDLRWVATGANDRLAPRLALMSHKHILPGFTDAGAHVRNLGYYDGAISLLKQAAATGFMTPEKAIARVTGEPARWFRLDTGVLKEGAKADFVLINPAHLDEPISPQVEIADPLLDGATRMVKRGSVRIIAAVYINGQPVVRRGEVTEILGQERLGEVMHLTGSNDVGADRRVCPDAGAHVGAPLLSQQKLRDRISDTVIDHPFTDYWDIFVQKHQNPYNIALHALGVIIYYVAVPLALVTQNWRLLLLLPLSQLVGLAGHYFFERSHVDLRDAIFSFRASRCLNRMFFKLITGKYGQEIRRTNEMLRQYQLAKTQRPAKEVSSTAG